MTVRPMLSTIIGLLLDFCDSLLGLLWASFIFFWETRARCYGRGDKLRSSLTSIVLCEFI